MPKIISKIYEFQVC